MYATTVRRRLPIGAEVVPGEGVHFRVWAPRISRVDVVLEHGTRAGIAAPLARDEHGYHAGTVAEAAAGTRYRFRLDGGRLFPDPASRFQPEGPHGPSCVIDPGAFPWTDAAWRGVPLAGQVIYEMHIGTFTREGTWAAAMRELPALARTGVTVLELMPVADFPGRFGWGYDGVDLFAPTRLYGEPDDFRRFVDGAHAHGLGVILDVVYNHVGPDGSFLCEFSAHYFSDRYDNEWGEPMNYDGPHSAPVRELVVANAGYWIEEYHLDGLRLDATQQIFDASAEHIVAAITRRVRTAGGARPTLVVAENEPQDVRLIRPLAEGGHGLDALWNDDLHHSAMVALTGRSEGYYTDHAGSPQELVSAVKHGYLYQGQRYAWQGKRRGTPALGVPPARFVTFIQNHDQVANSVTGARVHALTSPGRYRAMTALLLLAPGTPMLFQGQEFAASSPFLYFADHGDELAESVRKGRVEFLRQFRSAMADETTAGVADPADPKTFERSKLDLSERARHAGAYALHTDLLALRREDPVFRAQRPGGVDGAVLGPEAFVLRFSGGAGDDRLLFVNLGRDLHLAVAPEPLLAPPEAATWRLLWSSEHARYGGCGTAAVEAHDGWRLPGHAAVVMAPERTPAR